MKKILRVPLTREELKKIKGGIPPGCGTDNRPCGLSGLAACCAGITCDLSTHTCQTF